MISEAYERILPGFALWWAGRTMRKGGIYVNSRLGLPLESRSIKSMIACADPTRHMYPER